MHYRVAVVCFPFSFFLLASLTAATVHHVCNTTTTQSMQDYDILVLALQWPFSTCVSLGDAAGDACLSPPAAFIIDGLWPARVAGEQPRCCFAGRNRSDAIFSVAPIVDLTPQLRHMWPDMSQDANPRSLWKAQWEKHGSCSTFSCRAYFRKVLELSRRFDFLRALSAQGVVASARRSHKFDRVQDAADVAAGGSRVRLRCHRTSRGTVLDALHVCTDKDGLRTVNCPASCMEDDQACCQTGERIRIPFWSYERNSENQSSVPNDSKDSSVQRQESSGISISAIAGVAVLACACIAWLFRKFYQSHMRARSMNDHPYQRIR